MTQKEKIKELNDLIWRVYPFTECNMKVNDMFTKFQDLIEENKRLHSVMEDDRMRMQYYEDKIRELEEKISMFEIYVKAGEKIANLEKDFD
jgi:predicted nuclease with TOPRIM domain